MNKLEYLKACIVNNLYLKKDWLISILALVKSNETRLKDPYELMLVSTPNGFEYFTQGNYIQIKDSKAGETLFTLREVITIDTSFTPIVKEKTVTTIGRLISNMILVHRPFRGNLSYINKQFSVNTLESLIVDRIKDNPETPYESNDPNIYVNDYLEMIKGIDFLTGLSQVAIQGTTERSLVAPTGIKEFKAALIKKYGDSIKDPIIFQQFENELIEFDANYLKGDPGGEMFLSGNKNRRIVRKQLYLSMGTEAGMDPTKLPSPILNSLEEGWEKDKIPDILNTQRSGSFSRGAATALGGELTKWLTRASANLIISEDDCGSKLGTRVIIRENEKDRYINRFAVTDKGPILITKENISNFINKRVAVRSAMFCKSKGLTYCRTCLGKALSSNDLGLPLAVSEIGSKFMSLEMSAVHGASTDLKEIYEHDLFT